MWRFNNTTASDQLQIRTLTKQTSTESTPLREDIKVTTWNINGSTKKDKITNICWLFSALRMDVLVLTDTRLLETETSFVTQQIQSFLPSGTQIRHAPIGSGKGTRIGGQLIIISPKWSGAIASFTKDASPYGLVTSLILKGAQQDFQIIGTYWPCKPVEDTPDQSSLTTGSLWNRVGHWQQSFKPVRPGTPLEFVQDTIMKKT